MEPFETSFVQQDDDHHKKEGRLPMTMATTLVSNGSVDIRGRIADKRKTGGWKASPFIIANEVAERLAFYAIAVNMVAYFVSEMRQSLPTAATHVTDWIGAAFILTLLGAFLADAYLGRFRTILIFSFIYALGMILLTLSATVDGLRPGPCTSPTCEKASKSQTGFLYGALALIALGTGGIKPCVSSFGADQFDEADEKESREKYAFFNWFFFAINTGVLAGITLLVYLQVKKGWGWGFGVPAGAMVLSVLILLCGTKYYRFQKPRGSPFTRFLQVVVAAVRNHLKGVEVERETVLFEVRTEESDIHGARKLAHTSLYSFLDKAAVVTDPGSSSVRSPWSLCTVTQVEEFKSFIRILPVWASTIALSISFTQISTFFISQAALMDRNLGPGHRFQVPAASVSVFAALNAVFFVPIYEFLIVPVLRKRTGHRRGISSLQRMGVGLFLSIFATALAALVERKRRQDSPAPFSMSFFWLFPQFFLMGGAEVFTYVGQLEFFYDEVTNGTRSISSAVFLSEIGIGSWLSTVIVKIIERTTGGQERGWLRNSLNKSKLDYFYWVLTVINVVNFVVYVFVALNYRARNEAGSSVHDESAVDRQSDGHRREDNSEEFQSMAI